MAELLHWQVRCTICNSPADNHCNTCGDVLCSKCKENHLKSNGTNFHNVVPYSQRVELNRSALQCGDHPGHQCGVWCKTCDRAVCNECLISPSHKGHDFLKLHAKIAEKREEIKDEFEKHSKLLSDWKYSLQMAEKAQETYEENVKQLDKEIVDRADEICKQLRKVEEESRRHLRYMKDKSLAVYHNQQKTLGDNIQKLKKKIMELEDTLRSSDPSTILQWSIGKENISDKKTSLDESPTVPVFAPGSLDDAMIEKMFGDVSDGSALIQSEKSTSAESQKMPVLPEVAVIDVEKGGHSPTICCIRSGQAWIQTAPMKIQLVDKGGTVTRTVNISFDIRSATLTPQGDIILTDLTNNCIESISMEGDIKVLIRTEWKPTGICCLPNGDIVVTFIADKKIVQYSGNGMVIRKIMDMAQFHHPWYVAHSQVNQQIYVSDRTGPTSLAEQARVLVLDMNGTLQYIYTGSDPKTFTPGGICTDRAGRILITDFSNNKVHILDRRGNFMQYLLTGQPGFQNPFTIAVDKEGYAWVGEYNTGKLTITKYLM